MGEARWQSKISEKPRLCFKCHWLDKVKMYMHAKFDKNIPCGARVMNILIKRLRLAKLMLSEASSPFCLSVAGRCNQRTNGPVNAYLISLPSTAQNPENIW